MWHGIMMQLRKCFHAKIGQWLTALLRKKSTMIIFIYSVLNWKFPESGFNYIGSQPGLLLFIRSLFYHFCNQLVKLLGSRDLVHDSVKAFKKSKLKK